MLVKAPRRGQPWAIWWEPFADAMREGGSTHSNSMPSRLATHQSAQQGQRNTYYRAMAACLQGRGYTINNVCRHAKQEAVADATPGTHPTSFLGIVHHLGLPALWPQWMAILPTADRPDGNRMFLGQLDLFRFMVDHETFALTQLVCHRLQTDLDLHQLPPVCQGEPQYSIVLRRAPWPE